MKIIREANRSIVNIIGNQTFKKHNKLRLLNFCAFVKYDKINLLYNNMTKELIELNDEEAELLDSENIIYTDKIEYLFKNWFLVPVDFKDTELQDQIRNIASLMVKNDIITSFTILPTTDCNARCFYCYENGISKINMSLETSNDVVDFMIRASKGLPISINWFGGEPLFNMPIIDNICEQLSKKSILYESSMVTNGYLFDSDIIKRAKELWNLKKVQITLDGTEEIYNKVKNYINSSDNPFLRVINNIDLLTNNAIAVNIRLNIDLYNADNLMQLVDELSFKFNKRYVSFYVVPLYEQYKEYCRNSTDYQLLIQKMFKLQDKLYEKNLLLIEKLQGGIAMNACAADDDGHVFILPNGKLSKCEHALKHDLIGDIYTEQFNQDIISKYKTSKHKISLCEKCIIYPDCFRLKNCFNSGNKDCDELMQQHYKRRIKRGIINTYKKLSQ